MPPILPILRYCLYKVRSERGLRATIPERLDWLWFLGFDAGDEVPNHRVLSKARAGRRPDAFKRFFERIVSQGVQAGLVDGRRLFLDSCSIQANASNDSLLNSASLKRHLNIGYHRLQARPTARIHGIQEEVQPVWLAVTMYTQQGRAQPVAPPETALGQDALSSSKCSGPSRPQDPPAPDETPF